jgi:hypothetical protein
LEKQQVKIFGKDGNKSKLHAQINLEQIKSEKAYYYLGQDILLLIS